MGPRIYPSFQDTNLTAKGSLIISIDTLIDYVQIFINNVLVDTEYSTVTGLYSVTINVNDVVKISSINAFLYSLNRKDYTTDDSNGDNGIKESLISNTTIADFEYIFTATTLTSSYNFEYLISVKLGGARATLIYKYNPTVVNISGALFNVKYTFVYGFPTTGGAAYYTLFPSVPQFTGTTGFTFNLGEVSLPSPTSTITAYVSILLCYITKQPGNIFQGLPNSIFRVFVNGILQNTSTYFVGSPGFGLVEDCPTEVVPASVQANFTCNDGDIIEYVFDDNFNSTI